MTAQSGGEIWFVDTEWGFREGRLDHESAREPVVLCVVGLRSGRRLSFWGRDPRLPAFFRDHASDQFVAHYSVAEMKYLLRLGIPLPERWFDTFVAWRYLRNRPSNLEAGLSVALHTLGLANRAPAEKKELQLRIAQLRFDPDSPDDRQEIINYCFSDCDGCGALYTEIHDEIKTDAMAHWVEYLKAVARMELRGIPIDVEGMVAIREHSPLILAALIGDVNATWPIFDGKSFRKIEFLRWCRTVGIGWPTAISSATGKRYHPLDDETFKAMEWRHPFIAQVRQVRKTLAQFGKRSLVVDRVTHRHYYGTSVFRSVTGRNQPKKFIFSGPKWMRFLITPESPGHVLVYVDYTAQEIGIAAALSCDAPMREIYEASDCHMAFAVRAGAAPSGATKESHREVRSRYKTVNLGVLYGQSEYGIADRLGITHREAAVMLEAHRELFPRFWKFSDKIVQGSYDRGWIRTPCHWRSLVPSSSNERTWMNWPMQATGGDIMRLTVTYLDRQGVRILAPVHDGFLLSCGGDQVDDLRAAVDYACGMAVEQVLPGFPLRWDFTVFENGRFEDEDGLPQWRRLKEIVPEIAHVPA